MYHILYNPGACGDLVAAVIDPKDYEVTDIDVRTSRDTLRLDLRLALINNNGAKNILYNGFKKTQYFEEIEKHYTAITASHDFSEELHYITDTILIDDSEYKYAKWCMERCHTILPHAHPPFNEEEVKRRIMNVKLAKRYGKVKYIIQLKDILEGRLIDILQQWIDTPLNTEVYNLWLSTTLKRVPPVDE